MHSPPICGDEFVGRELGRLALERDWSRRYLCGQELELEREQGQELERAHACFEAACGPVPCFLWSLDRAPTVM